MSPFNRNYQYGEGKATSSDDKTTLRIRWGGLIYESPDGVDLTKLGKLGEAAWTYLTAVSRTT